MTSKTIWKFPLDITDRQTISIPCGAKLLDVQMQLNNPCLWALVDSGANRTSMVIRIYVTGQPISEEPGQYVATFQFRGLVFHVFSESE